MEINESGSCQCGSIKYRLVGEVMRLNICHCRDCQKQSGSAFGMSLIVPAQTFQLVSGELKTFQVKVASGRTKTCSFCPNCGVRIHNSTTPEAMSVKAGTLNNTSWLRPDGHYWTKDKMAWMDLPGDVPCHDEAS